MDTRSLPHSRSNLGQEKGGKKRGRSAASSFLCLFFVGGKAYSEFKALIKLRVETASLQWQLINDHIDLQPNLDYTLTENKSPKSDI